MDNHEINDMIKKAKEKTKEAYELWDKVAELYNKHYPVGSKIKCRDYEGVINGVFYHSNINRTKVYCCSVLYKFCDVEYNDLFEISNLKPL